MDQPAAPDANTEKKYTADQIKKLISDDRARHGREAKKALQQVQEKVNDKYRSDIESLEQALAERDAHLQSLESALQEAETAFEAESDRVLSRLKSDKSEAELSPLLEGLRHMTPQSKLGVLRMLEGTISNATRRLARPKTKHKPDASTPLDRLKRAMNGEKN